MPFLPLILIACGGDPSESGAAPTWNHDVLPLFEEHCTACHTDGGIGPMPLESYADLGAPAPSTEGVVGDWIEPWVAPGLMPPSGGMHACIDFVGADAEWLDDLERATVLDWIDAGLPEGDGEPVHFTPPPSPADALGPAALIARRATPYTPNYGGDGSDYACFMIDPGLTETTWVGAITPELDNKRIVHHMLLFRAPPNGSDDCYGEEMTSDLIAGWAPGQEGWFLPDGVGVKLEPGDWFALQIHYDGAKDNGRADQSGMGLHLIPPAAHEAGVLWTGSLFAGEGQPSGGFGEWVIPADDPAFTVEGTCTVTEAMGQITVFGAWPHMHKLGTRLHASTWRADAPPACLTDVAWDFDDQRGYQFVEPVVLNPGDHIDTTCTFDNTAGNPNNPFDPPRDVHLGETTQDEMCLNFLMYWPASDVQYCLF